MVWPALALRTTKEQNRLCTLSKHWLWKWHACINFHAKKQTGITSHVHVSFCLRQVSRHWIKPEVNAKTTVAALQAVLKKVAHTRLQAVLEAGNCYRRHNVGHKRVPANTDEPNKMLFGLWTSETRVLDRRTHYCLTVNITEWSVWCSGNVGSHLHHCKPSPYSTAERRVPELIPVLGSQPAGDMSHKPGCRLPLLSARLAVTLTTLKRAATNFSAWWTDAWWVWTVCLRLLPDSIATAIWTQALLCLLFTPIVPLFTKQRNW